MRGRRVDALAQDEVVVAVGRAELHAARALAGTDDLHVGLRARAELAIVHLEVLALEVGRALLPQLAQDGDVFGAVVVALGEVLLARPQAHLLVLHLGPAGDDVDAEAAVRDRIDGRGHARHDRRRDGQHRDRGIELDALGDGGEAGHQREGFEIVVPELALAAEAAQLDHRQREIEPVMLGLQHDLLVELEGRHVLRRCRGDQPAVVADRNEHTDIHDNLLRIGNARPEQETCQFSRGRIR